MPRPSKIVQALASRTREELEGYAARLDAWHNDLTGFGTSRDKTTHARFLGANLLEVQVLSELYHHSDMAARVVDTLPREMFRKGFSVKIEDTEATKAVNEKLTKLSTRQRYTDAIRWGRLFGGSAILIGANDRRSADRELVPERADDVMWLYVVDRRFLWPLSYYQDEGSPKFGQPETYMVSPMAGQLTRTTKVVHESRLILFGGAPTGEQERQENGGWDLSVLQRPHGVLRQFDTSWQAIENLLVDGHQAVYKMAGLADAISDGDKEYLVKRAQLADMARSVVRAMVIDAGDGQETPAEEFERQSVSFESIPQTLDKIMLRLAAAAEMPVTILMGQSPAGMNATGESDFRWFYDRTESERVHEVEPELRKLIDLWARTKAGRAALGEAPPEYAIAWPSLWSESPLNEAERRSKLAAADAAYVTAGVLLPEEVALSRFPADGFGEDIVLTDDARKSRERIVADDVAPEPAREGDQGAPRLPDPGRPLPEDENVQQTAFNGAQIQSLVEIVKAVANGEIPRESGVAALEVSLPITRQQAEQLIGDAGTDRFEPAQPEPPRQAGPPTPNDPPPFEGA
jgi:uncharacterized protein